MVKRSAGALLQSIEIDYDSPRTLSTQITIAIRDIILIGGLPAGARLPSTRTLAKDLSVSRTTMVEAFERLVAEGLLVSTTGAGTFVSDALRTKQQYSPPSVEPEATGIKQRYSPSLQHRGFLHRFGDSGDTAGQWNTFGERLPHQVRAFTTAMPALDQFPLALWARRNSRHWRNSRDIVLGYGDPAGYPPLRRAITAHLKATHGISCEPEQLFVTNGAQQAFHFIASVILQPGEKAWIENPGAIGARNALLAAGAELVPVGVDSEGIMVEQGINRAPHFRLAFVTPVHQQPMAVTMSLARRLALLEAAERANAWIIEDDFDGEFYYGSHRLPSLKSVDRSGRVFYVGTFSKTLFPALRLGYFLVPESMVELFRTAISAYVSGAPSNPQAVVSDFMEEGHYATHIRRMRKIYLERYEVFLDCSRRRLDGLLDIQPTDAGLHTIGNLQCGLIDTDVAARAEKQNITVTPIRRFCISDADVNGLLLGFSGIDQSAIKAGVATLARVLETQASRL